MGRIPGQWDAQKKKMFSSAFLRFMEGASIPIRVGIDAAGTQLSQREPLGGDKPNAVRGRACGGQMESLPFPL
jgi:hypothetical protein